MVTIAYVAASDFFSASAAAKIASTKDIFIEAASNCNATPRKELLYSVLPWCAAVAHVAGMGPNDSSMTPALMQDSPGQFLNS